jgi:hypothetical protein
MFNEDNTLANVATQHILGKFYAYDDVVK